MCYVFYFLGGPFGMLGWIRTGDGINNAHLFLRFRRFPGFVVFRFEVVIFWKYVFFRTVRLVLILAKPYYQNARINRGIIYMYMIAYMY